jgi:hypothetical protein
VADELGLLKERVGRLNSKVGAVKEELGNCLLVSTPPAAITLARGIVEGVCKQTLQAMGAKPPAMLLGCLQELERPEQMSRGLVPAQIITTMHSVRVWGNKAAHKDEGLALTEDDVALVVRSALRVVEWYSAEFERGPKIAPLYGSRRRRAAAVVLAAIPLAGLAAAVPLFGHPRGADPPARPAAWADGVRLEITTKDYSGESPVIPKGKPVEVAVLGLPAGATVRWSSPQWGHLDAEDGTPVSYTGDREGRESLTATIDYGGAREVKSLHFRIGPPFELVGEDP